MLSDPLIVSVGGTSKTMPRVGQALPDQPKQINRNFYKTADSSYSVETRQFEKRDGGRRAEITLRKLAIDTDPNTIHAGDIVSGFGFIVEIGPYGLGNADIASLRADLNTFVDSGLMARIIAGES